MKLSDKGLAFLIKQETGKEDGRPELRPFRDGNGYSIGYGHFLGPGKTPPQMVITEAEAKRLLREDVANCERAVNMLPAKFTQNQFDALVSFSYNTGHGVFTTAPTLVAYITAGNWDAVAQHLRTHWLSSNAGEKNILASRRDAEAKLFLS